MQFGSWQTGDFEAAIRSHFGWSSVCYHHAGGWYNGQIIFDRDDHAYTVVHVRPCTGAYTLVMLHRPPQGAWEVIVLPPAASFALERPYSNEPLEGPPAILLFTTQGQWGPCCYRPPPPAPVDRRVSRRRFSGTFKSAA